MRIMEKNNVTNLNEYKSEYLFEDNIEQMTPEMLEAYERAMDMNTPDLWSRIEAGYDREYATIESERKLEKKRRTKTLTAIAAAILIIVIAVPVMTMQNSKKESKGKDKTKNDEKNDYISLESTNAYLEDSEMVSDVQGANPETDLNEKYENVAESESIADNAEAEKENSGSNGRDNVTDERVIVVRGRFRDVGEDRLELVVDSVDKNEYEEYFVETEDIILIKNPLKIWVMDSHWMYYGANVELDSVTVNSEGKYEARIKELNSQ